MKDLFYLVRADIDTALVAIAKKHKLASLKCGMGSLGSSTFTVKVEGVAGGGMSKEAERYTLFAKQLRLPPLGTEFTSRNILYKTMGVNTTGTKILADRVIDGKTYLFPVSVVQIKETA